MVKKPKGGNNKHLNNSFNQDSDELKKKMFNSSIVPGKRMKFSSPITPSRTPLPINKFKNASYNIK